MFLGCSLIRKIICMTSICIFIVLCCLMHKTKISLVNSSYLMSLLSFLNPLFPLPCSIVFHINCLWHDILVHFLEGQSCTDLGEKNKMASTRWQQLNREEKLKYEQLAAPLPSASGDNVDKWHETRRVLKNLQENVCSYINFF